MDSSTKESILNVLKESNTEISPVGKLALIYLMLQESNHRISMNDFTKSIGCTKMSTNTVIKKLEDQGKIEVDRSDGVNKYSLI